jgi:hypothetical protein
METLNKAAALNVGLDPSNNKIRNTTEFKALLAKVRGDTPPIVHSRLAFTIPSKAYFQKESPTAETASTWAARRSTRSSNARRLKPAATSRKKGSAKC